MSQRSRQSINRLRRQAFEEYNRAPTTCDWEGCDAPVAFYTTTITRRVGTCERHTPKDPAWREHPAGEV